MSHRAGKTQKQHGTRAQIIRIIDVNANRAREALRVCEEITRFLLNHQTQTRALKKIRHDIVQSLTLLPFSYTNYLEERESARDVGRTSVIHKKSTMQSADIFIQNMKRAQEAVRVLEEFSKIFKKKAADNFQAIRFRLYQLEKKIMHQCEARL